MAEARERMEFAGRSLEDMSGTMKDLVSLAVSQVGADREKVRSRLQEFFFRLEEGETIEEIVKSLGEDPK